MSSALLKGIRSKFDHTTDYAFKIAWIKSRNKKLCKITNPILLKSAVEIAAKIKSKQISSEETVNAFIHRIKAINPTLNFLAEDNFDEALKQARMIDKQLNENVYSQETILTKPFLGVPFTIKITYCIKGKRQTAGVYNLKDNISPIDADVVQLMRDAGAIPLALTNVPELGLWWECFNKVHGRTSNPYNIAHTCGGSSGGEGAILTSGGSPMGIGSDVGGSIRIPSYFNGIYGHKTSSGIISNGGHLPQVAPEFQQYLSTGPMSKRLEDLKPMLKVLSGNKSNKLDIDRETKIENIKLFYLEPYISHLGVSPVEKEVDNAMLMVRKYFEREVGIPVKKLEIKNMKHSLQMFETLAAKFLTPEVLDQLLKLAGHPDVKREVVKTLVGKSFYTWPTVIMLMFPPKTYKSANVYMKMISDLAERLQDALGDDGVLFYPPHPRVAPYHNQSFLMPSNFIYTGIFNVLNLPVTQCPLGLGKSGLPLGVQVVSSPLNDRLCLAVAEEIDKKFGWVPPCEIEV